MGKPNHRGSSSLKASYLVSGTAGTWTQASYSRLCVFNYQLLSEWLSKALRIPKYLKAEWKLAWKMKLSGLLGGLHILYLVSPIQKTHPALLRYTDVEGLLHTALEIGTIESS